MDHFGNTSDIANTSNEEDDDDKGEDGSDCDDWGRECQLFWRGRSAVV